MAMFEGGLVDQHEYKRRKQINEKVMVNTFCPIITRNCRDDCMCFEPASWTDNGKGKGYYNPPYCSHALIHGYMIVGVEER